MALHQVNREILFQPFTTSIINVGTTATPLSSNQNKTDLIDSFILSLDAAAANNVFMGDQGVTLNSGIEIVAGGGPVLFRIINQNVHYEIMNPVLDIAENMECRPKNAVQIPFVIWDLSQIYLIAAAATAIRLAPFRSQFI